VNAIYQMQKCESVTELHECKKWIASFISAARTPFYRNSVEDQIAAADKYLKAQLVERNGDNEMIFRVWSPTACGDDIMSDF